MQQNSAQKTDQKTSKSGGKHIPRLYAPHIAAIGDSAKIDDATAHHHLLNVLRIGLGGEIRLFNENQGELRAVIEAVDKKSLTYRILGMIQPAPPPPLYQITLYFGLIKRDGLAMLLEKSTELGVDILQPLLTDYSQNEAYAAPRAAAITRAAAEQSRRLTLPEILPPVRINDAFAAPATDKIDRYFCCVEHENLPALLSTSERELLRLKAEKSLPSPNNSPLIQIGLVIGPEGGFSPREVALLSGLSSARLVTLGKEILRTETASLVGLSLLKALIPHILTQE